MATSEDPLDRRSAFRWNAGGFFVGSLGSSAWMVVAAFFLANDNQFGIAVVPLLGFLAVVLSATVLWRKRHQIAPFKGIMMLLGVLSLVVPVMWTFIEWNGKPETLSRLNWPTSFWITASIWTTIPISMMWCLVQEKVARRKP